jgi:ribulose-5-phosphate 4-epimerase/fuculose-1-phosphate aldolase
VNSDLELLREELLDASLILDSHELTKAYGHLSGRISQQNAMIMTPHRAPGLLTDPNEMIVVDFDGQLLQGAGPVPGEAALHGEIYRARTTIDAIVRTHAKYGNAMSIIGTPPRAVHGFGALLGSEIPIFPRPLLIGSADVAREVVAILKEAEAILLRGNGAVVLGGSIPEAAVKAILLEESCELHYLALIAGQPVHLTDDEITTWRDAGYDHYERAWEYYRDRTLFEAFEE